MLPQGDHYTALVEGFRWSVPARFNMGVDVCDRWAVATPHHPALIERTSKGQRQVYSFADVQRFANRLANALAEGGIGPGDRVGVLLPQRLETACAHIALYKLGAVAVPLFTLFGPDALAYRLGDCAARSAITDTEGAAKLATIRRQLPHLVQVYGVDGPAPGAVDLTAAMAGQAEAFTPVDTAADDPALLIYTSGTTGQPKGALHGHRVLLGHLPGVEMSHDMLPQAGDCLWTPADWAWIGGLLDVLLPAWHHGLPVVAQRFAKFDPTEAFALMAECQVRNVFLPPTALKLMRTVARPRERFGYHLRSVASGGEPLGAELLDWGRAVFGLTINEFYGQTECNMVVSSCGALGAVRPGVTGLPVPGHRLAVVDEAGRVLPPGELGQIAVARPDPVMFLGYWNNPCATRAKFAGDWLLTGDLGRLDEDGYVTFVGRADDVITSGGYRMGPGEIEDCLLAHPAVKLAAVVGVPDELRTEIVKAFIVLEAGHTPSQALADELRNHVKARLAAHEYPRRIAFVAELPLTATGKVMRRVLREGDCSTLLGDY